jgi:hypothetical protein
LIKNCPLRLILTPDAKTEKLHKLSIRLEPPDEKKKKEIRIREKERTKKKEEGRPSAVEPLPAWVTALHLTQPDLVLQAVTHSLMKGLPLRCKVFGL